MVSREKIRQTLYRTTYRYTIQLHDIIFKALQGDVLDENERKTLHNMLNNQLLELNTLGDFLSVDESERMIMFEEYKK